MLLRKELMLHIKLLKKYILKGWLLHNHSLNFFLFTLLLMCFSRYLAAAQQRYFIRPLLSLIREMVGEVAKIFTVIRLSRYQVRLARLLLFFMEGMWYYLDSRSLFFNVCSYLAIDVCLYFSHNFFHT